MDGIREQLVKRPKSPQDAPKKAMMVLGGVAAAAILLSVCLSVARNFPGASWILVELGVLGAIALVWAGWVLSGRLNVEYEYIIAGGEIQVDKIFNKKSRKTLCSFVLRSADAFYASEKNIPNATVYDVCGEGQRYTIEFSDGQNGKFALVFTPDERTLEVIRPYLPRAI